MANPRKFSEKIALHTQKQAEETAAFEAIIREVTATTRQATAVTRQPSQTQPTGQQHHLHLSQPNLGGTCRRSLPNVNQMSNSSGIDLQSALSSLEDMKQAINSGQTISDRPHRERSPQSQKKFLLDRHHNCSPYGSVYLCPPSDINWRRASSDSALHSSVMTTTAQNISGTGSMLLSNGPNFEGGQLVVGGGVVGMDFCQSLDSKTMSELLRPKSCDVPGINIFPSPESVGQAAAPGVVHVPIPNGTGSLPNLTNLSFSLPLSMPIDVEPVGCGPGDNQIASNYTVAGAHNQTPGGGAMPLRLHRHAVPVPLVLHGPGQMVISGNGHCGEDKLLPSNNGRKSLPLDPPSHSHNHFRPVSCNGGARGSMSPPLIVITDDGPAQLNDSGRRSEPLASFVDGMMDPLMDCSESTSAPSPVTSNENHSGGENNCLPPSVLRPQNEWVRTRSEMQQQQQRQQHSSLPTVKNCPLVRDQKRDHSRQTCKENAMHYGMVNNVSNVTVHSPSSPMRGGSTPMQQQQTMVSLDDACVHSAPVLYAVAHPSPHDVASLTSPGVASTGDLSPRSMPSHLSPAAGVMSPPWFSQSPAPSSPSVQQGRNGVVFATAAASGELSPAHATALQQQFQQFSMIPEDQLVARQPNSGVALYGFTAQHAVQLQAHKTHLQQQQQQQQQHSPSAMVTSPQQLSRQQQQQSNQQPIAVQQQSPLLAQTGLVFVPAVPTSQPCPTPFVWQVGQTTFTPQLQAQCAQQPTTTQFVPTDNPAFFRVTPSDLSAAMAGIDPASISTFGSNFAANSSQQLIADYIGSQMSPETSAALHEQQTAMMNSDSIPDIILTADDLPVYSNQPLAVGPQDSIMSQDCGINPLSYLGDSFDATTDLFTAEDALKLGLDPLEIEELQMLADASIVADPATEDSFRLDRQ